MNSNQSQILQKLLDSTVGPLKPIEEEFTTCFKDPCQIYEAASFLSEQLVNQNLNYLQRFTAIYLLIISYDEPAEQHPFIWTLLNISAATEEPLERNLIADILIHDRKQKYDGWLIEKYGQEVIKEPELEEEDQEIRALRVQAENRLKELQSIVEVRKETDAEETRIEFIRPFPNFVEVSQAELHWLSPGIISDVEWDNTGDIDRKLQKSRRLFNSALEKQLDPSERQQLVNSIEQDPHSPLHIGLKPQFLGPLMDYNPFIAAILIIKVARHAVMQEYLEEFLKIPTKVPLLDTIARILKQIRIPQTYMVVFCSHHMENVIKAGGQLEEKRPLICTMAAFMQCMFENFIIAPIQVKPELKRFMDEFCQIIDFGYFKHQLDKLTH